MVDGQRGPKIDKWVLVLFLQSNHKMDLAQLRHQADVVFVFREQAMEEPVKIIFLCLHNRKLIQFQKRYLALHK